MKLGVRAHDFGKLKPSELAETLKSAGFEAAQLALTKAIAGISAFDDITPAILDDVCMSFDKNNVEIAVLGCYVEIGALDKETRLIEVEKFKKGLEHAKALGANLVGTETTNFLPDMEHMRESAYSGVKDSVLRMAEKAEKLGVCIAIEPVADHTLNSAMLTRRLLDEVDSKCLKIILDPVNLILTEEDICKQENIYSNFFDLVGEDVAALHVKDIVLSEDGEKLWKNIGCGEIIYEGLFDRLRKYKKDFPILREHIEKDSYKTDIEEMRRLIKGDV